MNKVYVYVENKNKISFRPNILFFIVQVGAAAKRVKSSHCFDWISLATANRLKLPASEGWLTTDLIQKYHPWEYN